MRRHTAPESPRAPRPHADPFPHREAALHDIANLLDASLRCAGSARRGGGSLNAIMAIEAALVQIADLLPAVGEQHRLLHSDRSGAVYDTIHAVADLMGPLAAEHGVSLHADAAESLRTITIPGLFRVLTDLVRNSLESIGVARCASGGTHGSIIISGALQPAPDPASPGMLIIGVTDDGVGPPAGVTDPFQPGTTSRAASAGLGLAVARHIINRLRGTISLTPAGLAATGRPGAVVQISIPLDALRTTQP